MFFSSSGLTSRKKSPTEQSEESSSTDLMQKSATHLGTGESNDIEREKEKAPWYDSWKATIATWVFLFFLMYCVHAPARMKKAHRKAVDDQLAHIADGLSVQKNALASKIDDVAKSLELDKIDLGVVSKSHHEGELTKLNVTLTQQVETLKKEKEAAVAQKEAELKDLKARMATMSVNLSSFCPSCPFHSGGLRTSCGARMEYLISHYGSKMEDAKAAVMQVDPNCAKAPGRV